jgi:hypothetical protein
MNSGQRLKLACVISYALIVGGLTAFSAYTWQGGAHTRLNREVHQNEYLTDADLRSADQRWISGHFARADMPKDGEIRPSDVYEVAQLPPSSLAALAPMSLKNQKKPIAAGDSVRLCLGGSVAADNIKVEASSCDAAACLLTLTLPQLPKDLAEPSAAKRLKAVSPGSDCAD